MAMAGVPFTVGREGTNVYGESLAGIQIPTRTYDYSPYVIANNTNSGLLPFVQAGSPGTPGQGDNKVQCYNFRLCLTQVATNQIPITAPTNYSPANYALFSNYIAAVVASAGSVTLEELINVQAIIPTAKPTSTPTVSCPPITLATIIRIQQTVTRGGRRFIGNIKITLPDCFITSPPPPTCR